MQQRHILSELVLSLPICWEAAKWSKYMFWPSPFCSWSSRKNCYHFTDGATPISSQFHPTCYWGKNMLFAHHLRQFWPKEKGCFVIIHSRQYFYDILQYSPLKWDCPPEYYDSYIKEITCHKVCLMCNRMANSMFIRIFFIFLLGPLLYQKCIETSKIMRWTKTFANSTFYERNAFLMKWWKSELNKILVMICEQKQRQHLSLTNCWSFYLYQTLNLIMIKAWKRW